MTAEFVGLAAERLLAFRAYGLELGWRRTKHQNRIQAAKREGI